MASVDATFTRRKVEVGAEIVGDQLMLTVSDDGPGMSAPPSQPGSGTGLRTTRERLAQLYGDDARLETADASPTGAIVRVTIPLRPRDRELRSNA